MKHQKRRIFYKPRKGIKELNAREKKGKEITKKKGRREEGRDGGGEEREEERKKYHLLHLPLH